jgi:hypothetical protein
MNLLCGALKNVWFEFYNNYVKGLDDKTKVMVGGICLMLSIFVFILSTKGGSKSNMVNNWFLFWVSLLLFGVAMLYWVIA